MGSFWKEYTISLKKGKEYCYNIQNENTNCVIIRNYNVTKIKAGIKPHTYEVIINPNQTGLINRPFPLDYIYLISNKVTPVNIIETIIQNPVNNFIQQKITKNIIVQNTPQVYEEAYKVTSIERSIHIPPHRPIRPSFFPFNITLDCGIYGKPLVNIFTIGGGDISYFHIGFSNDNINYFYPYTNLPSSAFGYYPHGFEREHITLVNAFRYVRVTAILDRFPVRGEYFYARISATRHNIKNIRNLVTPADGGTAL